MEIPLPLLGSYFDVRYPPGGVPPGQTVTILQPNPQRWAIMFFAPLSNTYNIFGQFGDQTNPDLQMTPTSSPVMYYFGQVGAWVQQGFKASQPAGLATVAVCAEIVYKPPPPGGGA